MLAAYLVHTFSIYEIELLNLALKLSLLIMIRFGSGDDLRKILYPSSNLPCPTSHPFPSLPISKYSQKSFLPCLIALSWFASYIPIPYVGYLRIERGMGGG